MSQFNGFGMAHNSAFSGQIGKRDTNPTTFSPGIFLEILFAMEEATCNPFTQSMCTCSYSNLVHHTENSKNNATWGSNNVFSIKANGDLVSSVVLIYLFRALQAKVLSTGSPQNQFPVIANPDCPFASADQAAITAMGGLEVFLQSIGANTNAAGNGPDVSPCAPAADAYASYSPFIALFAAFAVYLKSGDNTVDAFSGSSYLAIHELTGDVEERAHLAWGGTNLPEAIELSETDMFSYVKTQFTLTADLGSSLALCASLFTMTEIHVDMRSLLKVIIRSAENVEVDVAGKPISNTDVDIALDIMYIILDDEMREMYQKTQFEVIIVRTVTQNSLKAAGSQAHDINLNVKGFLLGLIVSAQREVCDRLNMYYNHEGVADLPPFSSVQLSLDGNVYANAEASRFAKAHPITLNECNVPNGSYYIIAFTPMMAHNLKNNNHHKYTISSGINANTIDDITLSLALQPALVSEAVMITTHAMQLTFAQYKNGQLRLYTSS